MARKRMFSIEIIDTDKFLEMPQTTQNLYFHLGMRADDDGFVGNPKKIIKIIGANTDDLKLLITKNYVQSFEDGVIVITHWKINNYIQKDRYKKTIYIDHLKELLLDENNLYTSCIQIGELLETQNKEDKIRKDKERKGKNSIDEKSSFCTINDNNKETFDNLTFDRKVIVLKSYCQSHFNMSIENNIYNFSVISDFLNYMEENVILKAINIAISKNVTSLKYVCNILESWKNENKLRLIDFAEDLKNEEQY